KALSGCADNVGHLDGRPRHLLRTVAGIVFPGQGQRVERARGSVQAFLRKVEIDGGLLQIAIPQQDLDGPQIRSVFQQVSGEAVTQGVRWTSFRIPASSAASLHPAGSPWGKSDDRRCA